MECIKVCAFWLYRWMSLNQQTLSPLFCKELTKVVRVIHSPPPRKHSYIFRRSGLVPTSRPSTIRARLEKIIPIFNFRSFFFFYLCLSPPLSHTTFLFVPRFFLVPSSLSLSLSFYFKFFNVPTCMRADPKIPVQVPAIETYFHVHRWATCSSDFVQVPEPMYKRRVNMKEIWRNFFKSQGLGGSLEFFQVSEPWGKLGIFLSPGNMKKYEKNMKKYEKNMKKYEGIMKDIRRNIKEIWK